MKSPKPQVCHLGNRTLNTCIVGWCGWMKREIHIQRMKERKLSSLKKKLNSGHIPAAQECEMMRNDRQTP